jgi:hypothetical protein
MRRYVQSGQDAGDPATRAARIRAELEYLLALPGLDIPGDSLDPYLDFLADRGKDPAHPERRHREAASP